MKEEVHLEPCEPEKLREQLVEPFLAAVRAALGEMAGMEVAVGEVQQKEGLHPRDGFVVSLQLSLAIDGSFVLSFPQKTAAAMAGRILAGVSQDLDEKLIGDCMGEIANVVAGQAKALLGETPYHFGFSLPKVVPAGDAEMQSAEGLGCWSAHFTSEVGEFDLQLYLKSLLVS
jgi:chemotaxis protein CheX